MIGFWGESFLFKVLVCVELKWRIVGFFVVLACFWMFRVI